MIDNEKFTRIEAVSFSPVCGHEYDHQPQIILAYLPTRGGSTTSISSDRMCVSTASLLSLRLWSFYHSWFPLGVFQSKTSATDDLSEFTLLANEEGRLLCYFVDMLSTLASFEFYLVEKYWNKRCKCFKTHLNCKQVLSFDFFVQFYAVIKDKDEFKCFNENAVYSWFSHDVTKIRTTKLLIFLRFYLK